LGAVVGNAFTTAGTASMAETKLPVLRLRLQGLIFAAMSSENPVLGIELKEEKKECKVW